ncbi:hypothetical protein [Neorhizobium galegae]|uniref:hypothetical protein n=1 Tax=Neorhizobium galegae TaxID=399 RepID=UPI001F202E2C|nr:hypothetical protein [Neorhizobium galegae]UIK05026.1 hypothetical protein LZK81_20615 [Neorhizobium galegae]
MKTPERAFPWVGWGVAIGLLFAAALFAIWQGSAQPWCKADEPECFREWVAALGGWAAVVVAIPTVLFISYQIKDARKHQRDNAFIALRHTRMIAVRAINAAEIALEVCRAEEQQWGNIEREGITKSRLRAGFGTARTILTHRAFQAYEEEFDLPIINLKALLDELTEAEGRVEELGLSWGASALVSAYRNISSLIEFIQESAQEYSAQTNELLV